MTYIILYIYTLWTLLSEITEMFWALCKRIRAPSGRIRVLFLIAFIPHTIYALSIEPNTATHKHATNVYNAILAPSQEGSHSQKLLHVLNFVDNNECCVVFSTLFEICSTLPLLILKILIVNYYFDCLLSKLTYASLRCSSVVLYILRIKYFTG